MRTVIEQAAAALADNLRYMTPQRGNGCCGAAHPLAARRYPRRLRPRSAHLPPDQPPSPPNLAAAVASAQTIATVERRAKALALAKARHDVR